MAKQTFNVGGEQVRAEDSTKAAALAKELAGEKATVSGAIPVSSLTAPKPVPMTVPTPITPTVGAGLSANIGTQAQQGVDAFTQEQATATKAAESGYTNSLDAMLASLTSTEGKTGLTDKAYRNTVDPAKAALNKVNQQILADQEAERTQINELKLNAQGFVGTGLNDKIGEIQDKGIQRRAALAITQLAAQGELSLAQETADRAVAAALERQTIKNDTLKFIFEQNKERFTKAEQRQFETAQADRDRKLNMEEYKLKAQFDQQIKQSDPLYRANLTKAEAEAKTALDAMGGIDVNALTDPTATTSEKNGAAITALIKTGKVGQGTKTQLANVLGVVNAAEDLAKNNIEGKFEGINPLTGILSGKVFGVGLPFRETVKGAAQLQNEGYIEAINLRTQIWASGASLTSQQIDQVNRFTPRVSDTDAVVQAKLNSLTNFMLNQTKTQLQSEGIAFEPAKVDLFETAKLIEKASPEQRKELKAAGLIK